MTDRELLEAAARAEGITLVPYTWDKGTGWEHEGFTIAGEGPNEWNPIEDNGQALRKDAERYRTVRSLWFDHRIVQKWHGEELDAAIDAIIDAAIRAGSAGGES
jgi:hypothetical protein